MDVASPYTAASGPRSEGLGDEDAARRRWMRVLALAPSADLEAAWATLADPPAYRRLRGPETGLAMVRGRAGGTGAAFNLGEMSVTRCAVQLNEHLVGHAYIAGTDSRHAELAALFDALMQDPARRDAVETLLIVPLMQRREARQREAAGEIATSRVEFFTVARGEDP